MSTPARAFDAVLWDMDGTLVDTEPYWMKAEIELMGRYGLHWDETLGELMVGNTLLRSAEILGEHGLPLPPEQTVEILLDGVVARVREHVPFRPGALDLLADLRAHDVPCALVTMSYRRLAEAVVTACDPGTFTALITGDEVSAGKPDPEPYRAGAEAVGLPPSACAALEDSLPGLHSAVAAGTRAVGIPHIVPLPQLEGAVLVDSLAGMTTAGLSDLLSR
ncbi:HAD family hydrolase [Brevibacterium jeotgali]|uniref:Haloacid dehalogenase superfamily, subfamily IA, variant 3 with third motif having DD or ED n=1 Tax=Brevibacterium jeotgali TaxID=1262550 RepID=A0A2H1L2B5_9MICO|nr:HAD family phosphatase [Brevibacterium jeotgali]TWC02843.1 HAD superfamily hydrolase (TIGR01509 family) [Brevibacterium jeotgali]SMY10865.1 haloacid dehalogenase superfamily, subfamily IA, variant 3 with third motif having DD or ED [Brevibacterium jeotgali]